MDSVTSLSNLQIELLQVFNFELTEKQLKEIKNILSQYFADRLDSEMDDLFKNKGWGTEKIEEWSRQHMRTKQPHK